jgi:hypothetical protein
MAEAVHSLGRSVELAQEASGHILAAQPRLTNVYSLYATAFWPSEAGSAKKSKERIDKAIKSVEVAIEALRVALDSLLEWQVVAILSTSLALVVAERSSSNLSRGSYRPCRRVGGASTGA